MVTRIVCFDSVQQTFDIIMLFMYFFGLFKFEYDSQVPKEMTHLRMTNHLLKMDHAMLKTIALLAVRLFINDSIHLH